MSDDHPRQERIRRAERGPAALVSPEVDAALRSTTSRLQHGLATAVATHGLSKDELVRTQRAVARLAIRGDAPSLDDFWVSTALPRAEPLRRAACAVIDRELERLLGSDLSGADHQRQGQQQRPLDKRTEPGRSSEERRNAEIDEVRRRLTAALPANGKLDDLGWWWLRRLRCSARWRAVPAVLREIPSAATLIVATEEMRLLETAPWSYGDRLLSAFELVHADIRRYGRQRIAVVAEQLLPDQVGPVLALAT